MAKKSRGFGLGGEIRQNIVLTVRYDLDKLGFRAVKSELQQIQQAINQINHTNGLVTRRLGASATQGIGRGGLGMPISVGTMYVKAGVVNIVGGGGGGAGFAKGVVSPVFSGGGAPAQSPVSGPHAGGLMRTVTTAKGTTSYTQGRDRFQVRKSFEGEWKSTTESFSSRSAAQAASDIANLRAELAARLRGTRDAAERSGIYSTYARKMRSLGDYGDAYIGARINRQASAFESQSEAQARSVYGSVSGRARQWRASAESARRDEVRAAQEEMYRRARASAASEDSGIAAHEAMMERLRRQRVRQYEADQAHKESVRARQQTIMDRAMRGAQVGGAQAAQVSPARKSFFGPTGVASVGNFAGQMGTNLAKVTAWGLPAFAMTAGIGAVTSGIAGGAASMGGTSMQTARLGQVFRGVGGDARQLTSDILKLSAVENRSRQEAMESAIQWARTGTTKRETIEATRVSLMAANVAEISAADATERLLAVQKAYGLQIRELSTVLGMLNAVSNTYNATNAEMLTGLTRTASIAKQAGVPLAELVGIIGAMIGGTGQSGANVGNAVKSILTSLSNPEIQSFLETRYGLQSMSGGQMKSGSQRLQELWQVYKTSSKEEQGTMLFRIAGKTQSSRMAAMMDTYVTGQALASKAQRNLGSAESESEKIKGEVVSQWQGLVAATEQLLNAFNQATHATVVFANLIGVLKDMLPAPPEKPGEIEDKRVEALRGIAGSAARNQATYASAMAGISLSASEEGWMVATMDPDLQKRYNEAKSAGNKSRMRSVLTQAGAREMKREEWAKKSVTEINASELSSINAEMRVASADAKAARGTSRELAALNKVAELESRKRSIEQRGPDFDDELLTDEQRDARTQKRANASAWLARRMGSQDYAKSVTASGTMVNEVEMLRRQERELAWEKGRIGKTDAVRSGEIEQMLMNTRAEIKARVGVGMVPSGIGMTRGQDQRMLTREFVSADLEGASVGRDKLAMLDNETKMYDRLKQLSDHILLTSKDQLEISRAEAMQGVLREERERMILDRVRARAQAMKDEYEANRKLMTMGPQGLLTQLVGMQMQKAGVGIGGLLAASPEVREAFLEAEDRTRRQRAISGGRNLPDTLNELSWNEEMTKRFLAASSMVVDEFGRVGTEARGLADEITQARSEIAAARANIGSPRDAGSTLPWIPQAPGEKELSPFFE